MIVLRATTRRSPSPLTVIGLLLAMLAATVVVSVSLTVPASAATGATIKGVGSGRCLDVVGRGTAARTGVNIYDCNGQSNQSWTYTSAGELKVYDDHTCLDVRGQDTTSPATVQIYPCHGGANQRWRLNTDGTITGVQSGLCLDVVSASTANSAVVQLWTCHGNANQRWTTSLRAADTTRPSTPTGAQTSELTCRSVRFAWNAATDNVGVASYDVFHDGQLIKSVGPTTLSTTIDVVGGVTWGLYVNARDAAGNVSLPSETVPITPPPCQNDTEAPSTPGTPTASVSGTSVTLRWSAATDNVGVRAYEVFRGSEKVGTVSGTSTLPPNTTFSDSGLDPRTSYTYSVVARDAAGNRSRPSGTVNATTGAACGDAICGVTQIATDTDIPWGLLTLPDGTVLYGRRDAHDLIHLDPTTGRKTTVGTVPDVANTNGEGGLLGLAIAPTYASDHWLYLMHTTTRDNRIVRIKLTGDTLDLGSEEVLVKGIKFSKFHNGGRLRFGPDGKLYASTGDAEYGPNAQDKQGLNGKVLRLNPDGGIPSDNPFGSYVWSYGHRNPQGLAFDSQGRLWEQEFGNGIMDETNLIVRGGNYGWPACEGTSGSCGTAGFIAPKQTYPTSEGSCSGIAIVRDVLYVACERGTRLYRAVISGSSLTNLTAYFNGTYGRLRTVEPAPGGNLWLSTTNGGDKDSIANNSDNKILRVSLGS